MLADSQTYSILYTQNSIRIGRQVQQQTLWRMWISWNRSKLFSSADSALSLVDQFMKIFENNIFFWLRIKKNSIRVQKNKVHCSSSRYGKNEY